MKMTNAQIVATLNTIAAIKASDRKLPVRVSYILNKNNTTLLGLYKPYEDTLKAIDQERDSESVVELLNTQNDVTLHMLTLEDIEEADLSINEVEVIQTFMMEN